MLIALPDVRRAVSASLGERLAQTEGLCEHAAGILRAWVPGQSEPSAVAAALEDALFGDLYRAIGPSMLTQDTRGHWVRLKTETLTDTADRLLGVLFQAMPRSEGTCSLLRDCALRDGSVSAMETLLAFYPDQLTDGESQLLRRVVQESGRGNGEAE